MIKRVLRIILRVVGTFLALVLLYVLLAFALPYIPVSAEPQESAQVDIYILSNGVHTDIVVPTVSACKDWRSDVPYANTTGRDTTARWLALGWGDKGFYLETPTWDDLTVRVACRAAFGLGGSAMHATYHTRMTEGTDCRHIVLDSAHYARLCAYITESFARDDQGRSRVIHTDANYGTTDAFYEGVGRYSLFHTCNTWTNNGLKAGGAKACLWTPLCNGIFRQYR